MTWLFEPSLTFWLMLVFLLLTAVLLAAMWVATGRREPLWGAAGVVLLLPLLWLMERLVVTDREAIEATLHSIAADVKGNNRSAVMSHIGAGATSLRHRAEAEIPNYTFTDCKVNQIHRIEVNAADRPRSAEAEFNVYVSGSFKIGNETFNGDFFRRIHLWMRRESDGQWRVENYDHSSPLPAVRGAE